MKKPLKCMPNLAEFTRMVNDDPSSNEYDIESLHGHFAEIKGSFTSAQLRIIADAMDELKEAKDSLLPSASYQQNK